MRFFISCLFLVSLFATETAKQPEKAEHSEQKDNPPSKSIIAEPTSDTAKNQRRMLLDIMRKGVVIVKVKAHVNATEATSQSWAGTGFIIDKARGLIATNRHVAGSFSVCSYELKFSNGSKVTGRRRYVDPFLDFAILEVDPKSIPEDCQQLTLSNRRLNLNDAINVMGNAAGDEFSTQEGTVFNTFDTLTAFNDQSFHYAGITVGGASGSPIFDEKGEVVGIVYGGKFVSGTGLPIAYVRDALAYLQKGEIPPRKGIGARLQYSSLDELLAAKFITEDMAKTYRKHFPEAKGKVLTVKHVISGFDGAKMFEPGDILLEVNSQPIGPNLIDLCRVIDTTSGALKFKILRDDIEKEVSVTPDSLMHGSEDKMISFLGTVWFEHHDQLTVSLGNRDKGVYFSGITATSPLRTDDGDLGSGWNWFGIAYKLIEIDGKPVNSLKDLEMMIPSIEKKSMFTLRYIDLMGKGDFLTAFKQVDRNPREIMIRYEKAFDTPKRYDLDPVTHTWKDTNLGSEK